MTQEQKDIVIETMRVAFQDGVDDWWGAFVNRNRVLAHTTDGQPGEQETEQMEAWYALWMEAMAGMVQEGGDQFDLDAFYDMISDKWSRRAEEIEWIGLLVTKCAEAGVFPDEVERLQQHGY